MIIGSVDVKPFCHAQVGEQSNLIIRNDMSWNKSGIVCSIFGPVDACPFTPDKFVWIVKFIGHLKLCREIKDPLLMSMKLWKVIWQGSVPPSDDVLHHCFSAKGMHLA